MKRMALTALVAVCVAAMPAQAQGPNPNYEFGGLVFNHDLMSGGDFASLIGNQNFGTARSMAMGGAFASLGADMASLSLNPAGLGMYRRSEFSITPVVNLSRSQTPGAAPWTSNSKNNFALANIGAAINVFQSGKGAVTSITIGFGMNRIADFNSRTSYSSDVRYNPTVPGQTTYSIADVFRDQLQKGSNTPEGWRPIMPKPNKDNPNGQLDYGNPYFWPATLGYKGAMVHVGANGRWERDGIGQTASILRSMEEITSGSINEFDLSFGMNFNNIVYLGATLGIQSVYKRTELTYGEEYGYFSDPVGYATDANGQVLPYQLAYADLWQGMRVSGSGVNFKLGVIVRPTPNLRLGMAIHTPTFYSLDRIYQSGIQTEILNNVDQNAASDKLWFESPAQEDYGRDKWEFVSPTKLMFGASYALGNFALVSIDYERNWYNGIRVKNVPYGADFGGAYYKEEFKTNFCATNTVRAGIEVKPLPILALRVGGGYTTSMLKDESLHHEMPLATTSYYFSAGVGVSLSRSIVLDLAYQNQTYKQSSYYLFYTYSNDTGDRVAATDLYNTELKRHWIAMTLGFRF